MKDQGLLLRKLFLFFAGLLILAFGIAVSTISGLGISPLNCLAYVISEIVGLKMGYVTMILYIVYVLLEIPIKGKNFRTAYLLQIPVAVIFGFFVNWTKGLLTNITCTNYLEQIGCTLLSILLIALGTTVYVVPKLVLQAPEGLIMSICDRWKFAFGHVKTGFDITIVILAFLAGLLFEGKVIGIREGTLIAAVGVGIVVSALGRYVKPALERFCYGNAGKEEREN